MRALSRPPSRLRILPFRDLGKGTWQIGGFGGIVAPDRIDQPSQVRFQVYLSYVPDDHAAPDPVTGLLPITKLQCVELPIGIIGLVRVGDRWRDGLWSASLPPTDSYVIHAPHPDAAATLRAGHRERDQPLIPETRVPHVGEIAGARVLAYDAANGTRIWIHPLEICRFYLGTVASRLVRHIARPDFEMDHVVDVGLCDWPSADAPARIHLRTRIPNNAGSTLARFLFDPAAEAALMGFVSSLADRSSSGIVWPHFALPFQGRSTLGIVAGKRFASSDRRFSVWVHRIARCSAAFPFDSLQVDRDNRANADGTQDLSRPEAYAGVPVPQIPEESGVDPTELGTKDPAYRLAGPSYATFEDDPFPDLKRKQRRIRIAPRTRSPTFRAAVNPSAEVPSDGTVGVGDANASSAAVPVEVDSHLVGDVADRTHTGTSKPLPIPDRLKGIQESLQILAGMQGVEAVEFWTGDYDDGAKPVWQFPACAAPFPIVKVSEKEDAKRKRNAKKVRWRTWSFVDYIKGLQHTQTTLRRAVVARVRYGTYVAYIFDGERRVNVHENRELDTFAILFAAMPDGHEPPTDEIKKILKWAVKTRGCWGKENKTISTRRTTINHEPRESNDVAEQGEKESAEQRVAQKLYSELVDRFGSPLPTAGMALRRPSSSQLSTHGAPAPIAEPVVAQQVIRPDTSFER